MRHTRTLQGTALTLLLLGAGLAGCTGDGVDGESETISISIAGSSTVKPVADAWAEAHMAVSADTRITVAGGGSGAGASRVCSTDNDHVDIGDMSRDWRSSEATDNGDGTFTCLSSGRMVTQLQVAIDGLSVIVKKNGAADRCLTAIGGLSIGQLRWIYSSWTVEMLVNDANGGLMLASIVPNDDGDGVREWADLSNDGACARNQIRLWGADSDSGTYEYFGETVLCKNCFGADAGHTAETFDTGRTGGYQNSADDNVIVSGISTDEHAIGYFGYAYYEENRNSLSVVAIADNDTHGAMDASEAVAPTPTTVGDGTYTPLSRPLFMNIDAGAWDAVCGFLQFGYGTDGDVLVGQVGYVAISSATKATMQTRLSCA